MPDLTTCMQGSTLCLSLKGRVDSTTADAVEQQMKEARAANPHQQLKLDVEGLEYVSSAGLRVILRLAKEEKEFTIENASSEVYEIFEMTGFTEMLTIHKAYRHLSVDGCEVIGEGANGKVYRYDPDTIVKVYRDADALPDIQRERELARRAFVLGIPTAIPYDVVKVGESYGSVFELLSAKSFAKLVKEDPQHVDHYIDLYVDLLKKIHGTLVKPEDMPDMRQVALEWANQLAPHLPEEKAKKLVALVEAVPVDHHMMHGDYHVKNVMMQGDEVLLIDMDTLCQGHPVFELASMFNAYRGFSEVDPLQAERFLGIPRETALYFWEQSLRRYLGTDDEEQIRTVETKAQLVGFMRLARRLTVRGLHTEGIGKAEFEAYRNRVLELLDKVDTLVF